MIIALLITIAAAVVFGHTVKADRYYNSNINQVSYTDLGVFMDNMSVSQRFVCRKDVIDGFLVKTGVSGDHEEAVVTLELKDAVTGEVLLSMQESGKEFRPRKIHYFKTERLSGMKGRDLILTLSETGSSSGNGVTFYYAKEDNAPYLADLSGTALPGVLPMGTAVEGFDLETCIVFLLCVWFIWGFMWFLYKLFQ